jgi:hypothetical protein
MNNSKYLEGDKFIEDLKKNLALEKEIKFESIKVVLKEQDSAKNGNFKRITFSIKKRGYR